MYSVGILGASGFTGVELLRLCAQHPELSVSYATGDSQAGSRAASVYPSLATHYPNLVFSEFDLASALRCDVVFLCLPHEAALEIAPQLVGKVRLVVDLSAAFRLQDTSLYPRWYGFEHTQPALVKQAVYGLPEMYRSALAGATPLVKSGVIEPSGVIVDAASGVSGAGRALKQSSMFTSVNEDFTAYGLLDHRHTPEMEQVTGAQILFTPHLAPMNRGILATCYARPKSGTSPTTPGVLATLAKAYAGEPFVSVSPAIPSTKATLGTNSVHLTARYDERSGYVVVLSALDNLTKGASGGALQAANVALGLDEQLGLSQVGVYP
jgi:N-acetyl-gamma-glutamyl-phosphate reductase